MSTIIDHLIIELELDPKAFDAGKKKAAEAFLTMSNFAEEGAKKTIDPLEKLSNSFAEGARKALSFFAALATAKAAAGVAASITKSEMAIANMSRTTGESVRNLSLLQGVFERAGGSAQGVSAAILNIDKETKNFAIGKGAPGLMSVIKALNDAGAGIDVMDKNGKIKGATTLLLEIADSLDRLNIPRANVVGLLRNLGFDEPTVAVMLKGGKAIRQMIEDQKEIAIVTEKDVEAADKLTNAWYRMEQSAEQLARTLVTKLEPAMTKTLNGMADGMGMDPKKSVRQPGQQIDFSGGGPRASGNQPPAGGAPTDTKLPPTDQKPDKLGATQEQWDAYRRGLASIESSGGNYGLMGGAGKKYAGAYQMGPNEINETAKRLGEIPPSQSQFLANKQMQERYLSNYTDSHHQQLMRNPKYAAMSTEEKLKVLGYAHNQGAGGANQYINTGVAKRDAFGTSGAKYSTEIQKQLDATRNNAPVPWLSNPRLLRAPRHNTTLSSSNNYSTSETNVHSLIINGSGKPQTDDAYGIGVDAVPSLERGGAVNQAIDGPH